MAKKAAAGNKSQAIRDALAANPDKSPKDIAELLSAQGFKLNAQYVSTIKSNANAKAKKGGKKFTARRGRPAKLGGVQDGNGAAPMDAALAFIQAAGGFEQAKSLMATVEQIKAAL